MTIDIENARRFNEEPAIEAVSSEDDIVLVRLANGTGVKALSIGAIRAFIAGDVTALETEDKDSLVAAINELVGKEKTDGENIKALQALVQNTPGATAANALPIEKDLGTVMTAEMWADISAGKFQKVRTGNYVTINGHKYWMAHADYRLRCGDTQLTKHHMLVFPDACMYNAQMNSTNVTTGGYYGSALKTSGLANALAQVKADFGDSHIISHRILLSNAVSNGSSSGWAWYDSQIDLMNEHMVYGARAWGGGDHNGYDVGADKSQLALFQARPDLITNRNNWWLRDVRSAAYFCLVDAYGYANAWGASTSLGVRPAFLIG